MRRLRLVLTLMLLAATLIAAQLSARAEAQTVAVGDIIDADLSHGPREYAFVPATGSVYDVCVFPSDEGRVTSVELRQNGALLSNGAEGLSAASARLTAGEYCTLMIHGSGHVRIEIARHALSRCFDQPLTLNPEGGRYAKAIARTGDVHWYALTVEESGQPVVLAAIPHTEGLRLDAQLYSPSGVLLAEATQTNGGAALIDFMPRAGIAYRVRIISEDGGVGGYELRTTRSEGGLPESVMLSEDSIALDGRESVRLYTTVSPEGASDVLYWESSDLRVVHVDDSGTLTGRQPGTAIVMAYAAGAVRARCRVEVSQVPVSDVALLTKRIDLHVGDDAALEWRIEPENATDPRVYFEIDHSGIVEISSAGVVRGIGQGNAVVTIRTVDGDYVDRLTVHVEPPLPRYRALLVGEQSYAPTVGSLRLGSANSVAALRSMLSELSFNGVRFEIGTRLDATRDGVLLAIRETFAEATDADTALFYITCHGEYAGGLTRFLMYDGSILNAPELRQALEAVPGRIILLIDCCGSGGAIGRFNHTGDILRGINEVFDGMRGISSFESNRFCVLASASAGQDSYRIGFEQDADESDMATAYARAVCDAGGWSIERGRSAPMRADANYDGAVSVQELYRYVSRRVMWYLALNDAESYVQSVQLEPLECAWTIFEKS